MRLILNGGVGQWGRPGKTGGILAQFGSARKRAQKLYSLFVNEGITRESPWKDLKGQIFLGDMAFIENARKAFDQAVREIPRSQRHADRPSLQGSLPGTRKGQEGEGRGAFRRFKDSIHRRGIEKDWYQYRDERLEEIIIDWLEAKEIPFIRGDTPTPAP